MLLLLVFLWAGKSGLADDLEGEPSADLVMGIGGQVFVPQGFARSGVLIELDGTGLYAISDREGRFSFPDLREGHYTLMASREDLQSIWLDFSLDGSDSADIAVEMEAAAIVRGVVWLEDQEDDLAGTLVSSNQTVLALTDEVGQFEFVFDEPGRRSLVFSREGYWEEELTLLVRGIHWLDLWLSVSGFQRLEGQVSYQKGEPAEGAEVWLESSRLEASKMELTDLQGAFEFAGLPPGWYTIRVDAGDARTLVLKPLALFSDRHLNLVLHRNEFVIQGVGCRVVEKGEAKLPWLLGPLLLLLVNLAGRVRQLWNYS